MDSLRGEVGTRVPSLGGLSIGLSRVLIPRAPRGCRKGARLVLLPTLCGTHFAWSF